MAITSARQAWINRFESQTGLDALQLDELEGGAVDWDVFVHRNLEQWEQHSYKVLIELRKDVPELARLATIKP